MITVSAAIAMTAQCRRATAQDRQQNLAMLPGKPAATAVEKAISCTADDIGQLHRWPVHREFSAKLRSESKAALCPITPRQDIDGWNRIGDPPNLRSSRRVPLIALRRFHLTPCGELWQGFACTKLDWRPWSRSHTRVQFTSSPILPSLGIRAWRLACLFAWGECPSPR